MKLIHLSDLHLGKRLNEYSLLEDQKYILSGILGVIDNEAPAAIIIAGDIYDKSVPSAEAVELFDDFLVQLSKRKAQIFVLSGNHDSPERLAFGNRLMDAQGVHISPVYNGTLSPFTLSDEYGDVNIYMLPFIKPAHVRRYFPDAEIQSYTDAVAVALGSTTLDHSARNVLVTHQFVTGSERCESEELSVGGSDNVDAAVFDGFDYVALGHIHGPQDVGCERIRYCGTPLKYSFSEAKHKKSVTVAELGEHGSLTVRTVPLIPRRDLVELKGRYDELTLKSFYENTNYTDDYVHITLTDETDVIDAIGKLRVIYKNLMKLDYDNMRTRHNSVIAEDDAVESKSPFELFSNLFEAQNQFPMSEEQRTYMVSVIESIKEDSI